MQSIFVFLNLNENIMCKVLIYNSLNNYAGIIAEQIITQWQAGKNVTIYQFGTNHKTGKIPLQQLENNGIETTNDFIIHKSKADETFDLIISIHASSCAMATKLNFDARHYLRLNIDPSEIPDSSPGSDFHEEFPKLYEIIQAQMENIYCEYLLDY